MIVRTLHLHLLALALALLLAAACGGDDGAVHPVVRLTDPRSVPTATPWAQAPEPIILESGALTPISESGEEQGETDGGEVSVEVTPVAPFQITVDENVNRRSSPSTESTVMGTITAGEEKTVTGQVSGQPVEEGNDIWYQLDDGSFVYSGAVNKVQE